MEKADKEAKELARKSNYPQEIEEATPDEIHEIFSAFKSANKRNWRKK